MIVCKLAGEKVWETVESGTSFQPHIIRHSPQSKPYFVVNRQASKSIALNLGGVGANQLLTLDARLEDKVHFGAEL